MHLSGAASILGAINFICTSSGFGCFITFVSIGQTSLQKRGEFESLQERVDGLLANNSDANEIIISRGVSDFVKRKAYYGKLKPTIVTRQMLSVPQTRSSRKAGVRSTLSRLDVSMRAFYSTDTNNTSLTTVPFVERIEGDLRNTLYIPTENRVNDGAINTKNKDFIFVSICSAESLKSAYYQNKSNPKMITLGTSEKTLQNISELWFSRTSQLLLKHKYDFGIKKRIYVPKQNSAETRPLTITNPRNKIIEKSILNHLEPLMEGS